MAIAYRVKSVEQIKDVIDHLDPYRLTLLSATRDPLGGTYSVVLDQAIPDDGAGNSKRDAHLGIEAAIV